MQQRTRLLRCNVKWSASILCSEYQPRFGIKIITLKRCSFSNYAFFIALRYSESQKSKSNWVRSGADCDRIISQSATFNLFDVCEWGGLALFEDWL